MAWKGRSLATLLVIGLLLGAALFLFGADISKMELTRITSRAGWQLPDRVMEHLDIEPGDYVADIGAGDGYFSFILADAVGPNGRVYAVEVDDDLIEKLETSVKEKGLTNITVVKGDFDDPRLPDGTVDLIFLCHSYHHIEDRSDYFNRLRNDLDGNGRVAIIDLKPTPLVKLLLPSNHWTTVELMNSEMQLAHYRVEASYDFLPGQSYSIYRTID
jgi:ubiquinone/menaquinone biosynthesis C-methylase UbiE